MSLLGKGGDLPGADREHAEVSMFALHLLQSALVHVNTALVQIILAEPQWAALMTNADRRALPPLFWTDVNLYGKFDLGMSTRIDFGPLVTGRTRTVTTRESALRVEQPV